MAELRTMTVALEFKGQTGITGVKQFTAAITDADAAVDKLTAELGENAKVTIENVKSERADCSDKTPFASNGKHSKKRR